MKLHIATYNIHKGVSTLRSLPRVHALRQAINALKADLIFLQEVQGRHDRNAAQFGHKDKGHKHWPTETQYEFLAGESHHSAYGMNAVYDHGHHGNALLSALPIASATNQNVSDHLFEQRGILHCVLQADGLQVHCCVVHLGLFAGGRQRQTDALIEMVSSLIPSDAPLIIAGDFNDWRNQLSLVLRDRLGVAEVFDHERPSSPLGNLLAQFGTRRSAPVPARTFPAALPCLRLDRIYVRGFNVESARVLHGPVWAQLSDHAPVVATLTLK